MINPNGDSSSPGTWSRAGLHPWSICYAFEALNGVPPQSESGQLLKLKRFARYDPDPTSPKTDVHRYVSNRQVSPSVIMGMSVFVDGRIYLAAATRWEAAGVVVIEHGFSYLTQPDPWRAAAQLWTDNYRELVRSI